MHQLAPHMLKKHGADMPPLKRCAPDRNYSESHMRRLKKQRRNEWELSSAWLERQGYKATKVEAQNRTTGRNYSLSV